MGYGFWNEPDVEGSMGFTSYRPRHSESIVMRAPYFQDQIDEAQPWSLRGYTITGPWDSMVARYGEAALTRVYRDDGSSIGVLEVH